MTSATPSPPRACPALHRLPDDVADAWRDSCLGGLPRGSAARLLHGARVARLRSGEVFYRGARHADTVTVALVVAGLVRLYARAEDGRRVTLRYASPGALIGVAPVLA